MSHYEIYYAVRDVNEVGSSTWLFEHRSDAIKKCKELNAEWWGEWDLVGVLWFILNGFSQKWVIREEKVLVHDPEDFESPLVD